MNTHYVAGRSSLLASITLVMLILSAPSQAAYKCWKNAEGVRECGNAVPPEYAQQGHETIKKGGLSVQAQGAAKTVEELREENKLKELEEVAKLEEKKREQKDRVLLDTFTSADDMELTRDGQIAHLDSQIRLTQSHIDKLQLNLDKIVDKAADVERKGDKPGDDMVANIKSVRNQITENEDFIAAKRNEQNDIRERFAADISRFKELKGQR